MATVYSMATKHEGSDVNGGAPAVAINNVHKTFGVRRVLNGISLGLGRGETLGVLGRSAACQATLWGTDWSLDRRFNGWWRRDRRAGFATGRWS